MFLESFKITGFAVGQIFLLAAIGYLLIKKNILNHQGLDALSKLVIGITLPLLIFCQLVKDFKFSLYPHWWVFPLLSIVITGAGLIAGAVFIGFIRGAQEKAQFLSLVTFQNSGYLPLGLIVALLPRDQAGTLLVYLFLFLLGFNLVIWSLGTYILSFHQRKRFELGSLFSPPVIAILFSLLFIFLGLDKFMPEALVKPLRLVGDCTLPLAMFVIGGNLAQIQLGKINKKAISLVFLAKLIILPLAGLLLILKFKLPQLLGLLILMELAMPPATSLSLITRHYKQEDLLISQGVFFSHILSILTIPLFLSLYFTLVMIK
ncbi:MAG: AEC family transporter [Candidatus Omnitrophica bacterium]|nr:AEC family transporter [Candidatus Omnitrophota bacterium]MBU4346637.1 AEC family transporter [Candidatus Omnitrophota bacterium]MBU4473496.1 AEC family transporter [Candidatus Omnitrophota bacterium]MCG2706953.1 AEC family transporter [Candidatus Omnitrophota bacterium]